MKKKVGIAIAFALIAAIAICVVVMVCVQVNYKPQISNPVSITVQNSSSKSITLTESENKEMYEDILSEFEKSFTRSYLSAMFAGQTFNDAKVVLVDADKIEKFNDFKVAFNYSGNPQNLEINGEAFPQQYSQIIFSVSNNSGYNQINLYFKHSLQTSIDRYYSLTTYSSQANFYNFLNDVQDYK